MLLTPLEDPDGSRRSSRVLSLLASACLHATVIASIVMLPSLPGEAWDRKRVRGAVRVETAQKRHKIIWLRRGERLPRISPTVQQTAAGANTKEPDKLAVLTNPRKATHWDQFIYVPTPKIEEQKAIPSPSVVVTVMTPLASQMPPKPEPRKFVPPPDRPKEAKTPAVELQEPAIAHQVGAGLDMKAPAGVANLANIGAPKPASKKFVPPPDPQRKVLPRVIDVPEGLPVGEESLKAIKLAMPAGLPDAPRPPGRHFVPPAALAGRNGLGGTRGGNATGQAVLVPEMASTPTESGVPGDISAVIISAFPTPNASIITPEGNRLSKIRSGTMPGGDKGNASESATGEGLVVPGVTVRGGNGDSPVSVMAATKRPPVPLAASAATPTPLPAIRPRLDTPSFSVPQRPNSRRVPQQVEGIFQNRVVYCTVMPGPSGVPDWVVWFGETEMPPPGSRSVMRPPVAAKTALSPGNPGGSAGAKLWIVARLGRNGKLSAVNITAGLAAEQSQELANEMEKWVFTPAIRNGEAVDVDLVLEAKLPNDRPRL